MIHDPQIDNAFLKVNQQIHDNLEIVGDTEYDEHDYFLAVKETFNKRFGHDWRLDPLIMEKLGASEETGGKHLPFIAEIKYQIGLGYSTDDGQHFTHDGDPNLHDFNVLKVRSLRDDVDDATLLEFIHASDATFYEMRDECMEYMRLFKDFDKS